MRTFLTARGVETFCDINDDDGRYERTSWCVDDELTYDQFSQWTGALEQDERFDAILVTMNSHHPFWAPDPERNFTDGDDGWSRYVNAAHYHDYLIGQLVDSLQAQQRLDDTVIVVLGDHGTVFQVMGNTPTIARHLINPAAYHIPCYIYLPFGDQLPPEFKTSHVVTGHSDILPTLLDIIDIPPPHRTAEAQPFRSRHRVTHLFCCKGWLSPNHRRADGSMVYPSRPGQWRNTVVAGLDVPQRPVSSAPGDPCRNAG